jgi:hypothetical protein
VIANSGRMPRRSSRPSVANSRWSPTLAMLAAPLDQR